MIDEPAIRGNSVEPVLSCLLRLPRVSNPTIPLPHIPSFHFAISFSCISIHARFITVSAEQICEIPNCYRLESIHEVSILLFTSRKECLNYLEILLNENLFLWFSEALEYAADAPLKFFSRHAHPSHVSFLRSWRLFARWGRKIFGSCTILEITVLGSCKIPLHIRNTY